MVDTCISKPQNVKEFLMTMHQNAEVCRKKECYRQLLENFQQKPAREKRLNRTIEEIDKQILRIIIADELRRCPFKYEMEREDQNSYKNFPYDSWEKHEDEMYRDLYLDLAKEKICCLDADGVAKLANELGVQDLENQKFELGFWKKDGRLRQHRQYMEHKCGSTSKLGGKNYKERVSKKHRQRGLKDK